MKKPKIYTTTQHFNTILKNIILNKNHQPNFNNNSLTKNTHYTYPLNFIP
ncbi:phosphoenolpyruvate carboxykinase (ATP), partial [Enterococcus hirae]